MKVRVASDLACGSQRMRIGEPLATQHRQGAKHLPHRLRIRALAVKLQEMTKHLMGEPVGPCHPTPMMLPFGIAGIQMRDDRRRVGPGPEIEGAIGGNEDDVVGNHQPASLRAFDINLAFQDQDHLVHGLAGRGFPPGAAPHQMDRGNRCHAGRKAPPRAVDQLERPHQPFQSRGGGDACQTCLPLRFPRAISREHGHTSIVRRSTCPIILDDDTDLAIMK